MDAIIDEENRKYVEPFIEDGKLYLVLRLMKHAITRSVTNSDYFENLSKEEAFQTHIHKNKKLIKIICKYYRICGLTNKEVSEISIQSHDKVYDYLIERTSKIYSYAKCDSYPISELKINILRELKQLCAYNLNEDFYDLQNRMFDAFETNIIIKAMHDSDYKPNARKSIIVPQKRQTKKLSGNTYISIDVRSANFSWLFNYIGNYVFKLGMPVTYQEFVESIGLADNKLLIESKHMRQIVFGKVFKKYRIGGAYEADINYITSLFTNLILEMYPNAMVVMPIMNEECVFLKADSMSVDAIREKLNSLVDLIGPEMVNKLNVTEFTYRKVGNVTLKNNEPIMMPPELGYQVYLESTNSST